MGIEPLTEQQIKALDETKKKLYFLSQKKYKGNIIINSDDGVMKSVEYKVRDEIKIN